ncbi:MAG TPA: Lpg1974 family pore-forming outer membrane protein [Gemmataceae bacterium]|jgi:hypothetical protein|nr:Lpg1974 family pore-forming outer membrane protein [Gemmataceae bacterium]
MKWIAEFTAGVLVLACLSPSADAADPAPPPAVPVQGAQAGAMPPGPPPLPPLVGDRGPVVHFEDVTSDPGAQQGGHFVAGAGLYLIKPFFDTNPAFRTSTTTVTGGIFNVTSTTQTQQQDFEYDLAAAPLIWIGYVADNGLGVRGRWWSFDQGSRFEMLDQAGVSITSAAPQGLSIHSPGSVLFPGVNADSLAFNSNLRLDVWDLEATQDFRLGGWALTVSGGARYVHMAQNYNAYRTNPGGVQGVLLVTDNGEALHSGHNFNGAGPTVALEVRRPLGDTGLALYGNARGSLLYGDGKQHTTLSQQFSGVVGVTPFDMVHTSDVVGSRDDLLPIVELELGAEYGMDMGRLRPFIRTGVVGQTWFGAGNATSVTGNLGFLGLTATAGVNY